MSKSSMKRIESHMETAATKLCEKVSADCTAMGCMEECRSCVEIYHALWKAFKAGQEEHRD